MKEPMSIEDWLEIRKETGKGIDPQTAEVTWNYGQVLDPYGVYSDLRSEEQQVGRNYFARSPGSDVWVSFHDFPEGTRNALWGRREAEPAFPAWLCD